LYLNLTIPATGARKTSLCGLEKCVLLIPEGHLSMVETHGMGKGDINNCNKIYVGEVKERGRKWKVPPSVMKKRMWFVFY